MKKVRFIYNPYSGENKILNYLDEIMKLYQENNQIIVPYRIEKEKNLDEALEIIDETYEYILVAGGDGTVDSVVNSMMKYNIKLPIGILPVGTANDFGQFIGVPKNIIEACKKIINSEPKLVDIGRVNDKYFINVASTGLFTDISQKTNTNLKNTMGKVAYFLKGIEEIHNFKKLEVSVKSKEFNYYGEMYLILVFNGRTAGNLKLATKSIINDGKLDVIIFKALPIKNLLLLVIEILKGRHLDSNKLIYFKTNELYIDSSEDIITDIDGERGPDFPLKIQCIEKGIQIMGIQNK